MHIHQDTIDGTWNEFKGAARSAWGKLTDDKLEQTRGNAEYLAGLLQKEYGMSIEKARDEIDAIAARYDNMALKGDWTAIKGKVREAWGDLTDDEIEKTAGRRSQLVGLLEKRYGENRAKAWEAVNDFVKRNF
ncbi:hypothetical protein DEA8626_01803 [Defluviimonas aquaemixtae]|uniref:CsbD-like domain-containing protein n=1 Tax=Albidovulum aquaemixtae TaxID=1542388 RepID=A0A2R8B6J1_9RHOB|nr:CsbD family protein [Defluviimonas aquaemixtae]SPH18271.1 hypothetical protein DEA8626_01803 [Defluviimonas aquaemixtae]